MKHLRLVPTDLSEHSRRALVYGCWLAAEENAALLALHVANDLNAWEFYANEFADGVAVKPWPIDRILAEASLDLSRFLEASITDLKKVSAATTRVVLGPIAERISAVAEKEKADLITLSPRRRRGVRHILSAGIIERISRSSSCPVLSIASPLPSEPWRGKYAPGFFPWPRRKIEAV